MHNKSKLQKSKSCRGELSRRTLRRKYWISGEKWKEGVFEWKACGLPELTSRAGGRRDASWDGSLDGWMVG